MSLDAPAPRRALRETVRVGLRSTAAVWATFAFVHLVLFFQAHLDPQALYGDPALYNTWAVYALRDGVWPVLDTAWVYPVGALVPIVAPALLSFDTDTYRVVFMLMVTVLNGFALGALLHAGRGRKVGAWWWLAFLLALGPISLVRLDGVSAALTILALVQLIPSRRHPEGRVGLASTLTTIGAWIKVAPGAALIPMFITDRRRWRRVALPAVTVSVVVVGLALLGGSGARVLGFFSAQDSRGLQIESGAATPFSIARLWDHRYSVFYNEPLNVLEITGPGTALTAKLLNVALLVAVAVATFVIWRSSVRLRHDIPDDVERRAPQLELVLLGTLVLSLILFAFNKVGSPQYVAWFAPPVAVALTAFHRAGVHVANRRTWTAIAWLLILIALLTQWLFPLHYNKFLRARPLEITTTALRNVLILALVIALLALLMRHVRRPGPALVQPTTTTAGDALPSAAGGRHVSRPGDRAGADQGTAGDTARRGYPEPPSR